MDSIASGLVSFWQQAGRARWFAADDAFDAQCAARFLHAHLAASRREFEHWLGSAEEALALVLLLDQIPRNVYRGSAHAYATDALARHHADRAIASGFDRMTPPELRQFFYLPFEHSESPADQQRALQLFTALGDPDALHWARLHHDIIGRVGRFPPRNAVLARVTTPEERAFLDGGGFAG